MAPRIGRISGMLEIVMLEDLVAMARGVLGRRKKAGRADRAIPRHDMRALDLGLPRGGDCVLNVDFDVLVG